MADYGVTPTGFVRKPLEVLLEEYSIGMAGVFGEGVDVTATSVLGQAGGVFLASVDELWGVAESVYSARNPDSAVGDAQDNLCSLTGVIRQPAETSLAEGVLCTGDSGTTIDQGTVIAVVGTGVRFVALYSDNLAPADPWQATTSYALDDIRTNNGNIYIVTVPGLSAVTGGPSGTGTDIIDNQVHWRFVGEGVAFAAIDFESQDAGPIPAPAYTLTTIVTPISRWYGVANPTDATLGRLVETNEQLRLKREQTLRSPGSSAVDAIAARVRILPNVVEAFVFENVTIVTSPEGLPGKSFEVVVDGGDDREIAQAIFDSKPIGILSHGTTTVYIDDSQGTSHAIKFSRPESLDLYVDMTVKVDPAVFPLTGIEDVKLALVTKGATLGIGDEVVVLPLRAAPLTVPGVIDVYSFEVDTVSPPVNVNNIPVTTRQRAQFDTSRVTVAVVN